MIGQEIRNVRIKAGLSQEKLASMANVHRTYISLLERNKKSPTLEVFFRICRALRVSPSKLLSKIENEY